MASSRCLVSRVFKACPAYHYVAGRGLAGVGDAAPVLKLQFHPGQRNAGTLLRLLRAWFLLTLGALVMAGALHITAEALARSLSPPLGP